MRLQDALRDYTVSDALSNWHITPVPKVKTPVPKRKAMKEDRLKPGQIIRYGPAFYQVEYVNECRALIVPLAKRKVELPDGKAFEAQRGGVNISPNSSVEIITDLDRARDQMELEAIEEELRATKAALEQPDVTVAPPVVTKPKPHLREPVRPGGGWHVVADRPEFKDGTLAAGVWEVLLMYPGLPTSEIVATAEKAGIRGAIAACVSRFHQAGLIEKR